MQSHSSQSVIDKREIYIFSVSIFPYICQGSTVKDPRPEKSVHSSTDPVDSSGLWIPDACIDCLFMESWWKCGKAWLQNVVKSGLNGNKWSGTEVVITGFSIMMIHEFVGFDIINIRFRTRSFYFKKSFSKKSVYAIENTNNKLKWGASSWWSFIQLPHGAV